MKNLRPFLIANSNETQIERILLVFFLFLLPLQEVHISTSIPISWCDILIIPITINLLIKIKSIRLSSFSKIDKYVCIFFLFQITSVITQSDPTVFTHELITAIYLPILYFAFVINLNSDRQEATHHYLTIYALSSLLVAILSIAGWVFSTYTAKDCLFALEYVDYPYFGSIYRTTAFFHTPTMLFNYLQIPLFYSLTKIQNRSTKRSNLFWNSTFLLLFIAAILTFSKSILLTIGLLFILVTKNRSNLSRKFSFILLTLLILVSSVSSHFLFFGIGQQKNTTLKHTSFTSNHIIVKTKSIEVVESFYFFSKRCGWEVFKRHPLFGIGTGNFQKEISELDKRDFQSLNKLKTFDPHSTYFGILVENGSIGFMLFILLLLLSIGIYRKALDSNFDMFLLRIIGISTLFFLLEGSVTDFHHFRFFWFGVALISSFVKTTSS